MNYVKLTECEGNVMKCIWDAQHECRVSDLIDMLKSRGMNYKRTTVATYLLHLKEKGYVRISREDKNVFYYEPAVSYTEYRKEKSKNYLDYWYKGNVDEFLNDLV